MSASKFPSAIIGSSAIQTLSVWSSESAVSWMTGVACCRPTGFPSASQPSNTTGPAASAQTTVSLSDTSQTTVLTATVNEQAKVTFPTGVTFTVNDVTGATTLKSSGYSGYDDALVSAVRASHYQPYIADGHAVPACSALSFAYAIE